MKTEKERCKRFNICSAALCPLDPHPRRYWYADTEICGKRGNVPKWIQTQKRIQAVNPDPHCYYTQLMLESITTVRRDISGIIAVGYDKGLESVWIERRNDRHKQGGESVVMLKHGGEPGFKGINIDETGLLQDTCPVVEV